MEIRCHDLPVHERDNGVGCGLSVAENQARSYRLCHEARTRLNTVYMVTLFDGGAIGSFGGSQAWSRWGWTGAALWSLRS